MKKLAIFVLFFLTLGGVYFYDLYFREAPRGSIETRVDQNPDMPQNSTEVEISEDNGDLKAVWLRVESNDKIFLYNNLQKKLSSTEAMTMNQCASLVSAYFYDSEGPLGLVITESQVISNIGKSSLLSGIFAIDKGNIATITKKEPQNIKIAVQSGPLIMFNSKILNVESSTNEAARRIVAAIDAEGRVYFISLYKKDNPLRGPNLEELPSILSEVNEANNLNLVSALNLDGGSHSAFVTEFSKLTEVSTIGGYFCVKP